jgi:hypothetical protein
MFKGGKREAHTKNANIDELKIRTSWVSLTLIGYIANIASENTGNMYGA